MLKKVCHWIFGLCMVAGFIFLVGTAGASDCNTITDIQIVKQIAIGLVLMLVGFCGLRFTDWEYMN